MQCLYCKKRLGLFASKKRPFCSKLHEDWFHDEQSGTAIRRLLEPFPEAADLGLAPPESPDTATEAVVPAPLQASTDFASGAAVDEIVSIHAADDSGVVDGVVENAVPNEVAANDVDRGVPDRPKALPPPKARIPAVPAELQPYIAERLRPAPPAPAQAPETWGAVDAARSAVLLRRLDIDPSEISRGAIENAIENCADTIEMASAPPVQALLPPAPPADPASPAAAAELAPETDLAQDVEGAPVGHDLDLTPAPATPVEDPAATPIGALESSPEAAVEIPATEILAAAPEPALDPPPLELHSEPPALSNILRLDPLPSPPVNRFDRPAPLTPVAMLRLPFRQPEIVTNGPDGPDESKADESTQAVAPGWPVTMQFQPRAPASLILETILEPIVDSHGAESHSIGLRFPSTPVRGAVFSGAAEPGAPVALDPGSGAVLSPTAFPRTTRGGLGLVPPLPRELAAKTSVASIRLTPPSRVSRAKDLLPYMAFPYTAALLPAGFRARAEFVPTDRYAGPCAHPAAPGLLESAADLQPMYRPAQIFVSGFGLLGFLPSARSRKLPSAKWWLTRHSLQGRPPIAETPAAPESVEVSTEPGLLLRPRPWPRRMRRAQGAILPVVPHCGAVTPIPSEGAIGNSSTCADPALTVRGRESAARLPVAGAMRLPAPTPLHSNFAILSGSLAPASAPSRQPHWPALPNLAGRVFLPLGGTVNLAAFSPVNGSEDPAIAPSADADSLPVPSVLPRKPSTPTADGFAAGWVTTRWLQGRMPVFVPAASLSVGAGRGFAPASKPVVTATPAVRLPRSEERTIRRPRIAFARSTSAALASAWLPHGLDRDALEPGVPAGDFLSEPRAAVMPVRQRIPAVAAQGTLRTLPHAPQRQQREWSTPAPESIRPAAYIALGSAPPRPLAGRVNLGQGFLAWPARQNAPEALPASLMKPLQTRRRPPESELWRTLRPRSTPASFTGAVL